VVLGGLSATRGEAAISRVPADHATIQAAIDAAAEGDLILVEAGTYRERIRLKPGITVRSAGGDATGTLGLKRAEEAIIDGGGAPVAGEDAVPGVAMAEGATIDGFTVTRVGEFNHEAWMAHYETRGENQPHEDIGHFGTPGIGAAGVKCVIVNNLVHHNGHTGIAIRGEVGATIQPEVRANVCYRNMGGGIGIMGGAAGTVAENHCFENFYAGIGHAGASPLVQGNRCHGNIRAGIGISAGACPVVRGNACFENRRAGIGIRTGKETRPVVEDNDCYRNGMAGIGCEDEAAPELRMNRCYENEMAGIGVGGNAAPRIERNECHDNKLAGIGFAECADGSAMVRGNQVVDNGTVGIGVHSGWKIEIEANSFRRSSGLPPAIMVFEGADCTIHGNSFHWSGVAGVRVAGRAAVTGNKFDGLALRKAGPPQFGVWALPGSTVVVSENSFVTMRHGLHASEAHVTAVANTAEEFAGAAFVVEKPRGKPELRDNHAISADPQAVVVQAAMLPGPFSRRAPRRRCRQGWSLRIHSRPSHRLGEGIG
jgi:hypothetical protein